MVTGMCDQLQCFLQQVETKNVLCDTELITKLLQLGQLANAAVRQLLLQSDPENQCCKQQQLLRESQQQPVLQQQRQPLSPQQQQDLEHQPDSTWQQPDGQQQPAHDKAGGSHHMAALECGDQNQVDGSLSSSSDDKDALLCLLTGGSY